MKSTFRSNALLARNMYPARSPMVKTEGGTSEPARMKDGGIVKGERAQKRLDRLERGPKREPTDTDQISKPEKWFGFRRGGKIAKPKRVK